MIHIVKISLCMILMTSCLHTNAIEITFPGMNTIVSKFSELVDNINTTLKSYQAKEDTGDHILQQVQLANKGLDNFNENLQKSIFMKNNIHYAAKVMAYTMLGCAMSILGLKLVHKAYKKIQEKLDDPEQQKNHWYNRLSKNDYLYLVIGITTIGYGIKIIEDNAIK